MAEPEEGCLLWKMLVHRRAKEFDRFIGSPLMGAIGLSHSNDFGKLRGSMHSDIAMFLEESDHSIEWDFVEAVLELLTNWLERVWVDHRGPTRVKPRMEACVRKLAT